MPTLGEVWHDNEIGKSPSGESHFQYIWLACGICRAERWVKIVCNKPESALCHKCAMNKFNKEKVLRGLNKGENHWHWEGGKTRKVEGYIEVLLPNNSPFIAMSTKTSKRSAYVYEHRLVMAKHLGRLLLEYEVVHHINGIKDDNRIENLQLTNHSEHSRHHITETRLTKRVGRGCS